MSPGCIDVFSDNGTVITSAVLLINLKFYILELSISFLPLTSISFLYRPSIGLTIKSKTLLISILNHIQRI